MPRAVFLSAVRTPVGRYGGALADVRPDDLAAVGRQEKDGPEEERHADSRGERGEAEAPPIARLAPEERKRPHSGGVRCVRLPE